MLSWIKKYFSRRKERRARRALGRLAAETENAVEEKRRECAKMQGEAERLRREAAFLRKKLEAGDFGGQSEEGVRDGLREREKELRRQEQAVKEAQELLDMLRSQLGLLKGEQNSDGVPRLDGETIRRMVVERKLREDEHERHRIKLAAGRQALDGAESGKSPARMHEAAGKHEQEKNDEPASEKSRRPRKASKDEEAISE